jgi:hypothetical protein
VPNTSAAWRIWALDSWLISHLVCTRRRHLMPDAAALLLVRSLQSNYAATVRRPDGHDNTLMPMELGLIPLHINKSTLIRFVDKSG